MDAIPSSRKNRLSIGLAGNSISCPSSNVIERRRKRLMISMSKFSKSEFLNLTVLNEAPDRTEVSSHYRHPRIKDIICSPRSSSRHPVSHDQLRCLCLENERTGIGVCRKLRKVGQVDPQIQHICTAGSCPG